MRRDDDGWTPLDRADGENAELLRKHGGKSGAEDSVLAAAGIGNIAAIKQQLADGADVNTQAYGGSTPLQKAAE